MKESVWKVVRCSQDLIYAIDHHFMSRTSIMGNLWGSVVFQILGELPQLLRSLIHVNVMALVMAQFFGRGWITIPQNSSALLLDKVTNTFLKSQQQIYF